MSLPYTSKFYSNGTIFDSFGDPDERYSAYYIDNNILYYTSTKSGYCSAIDLNTESLSTLDIVGVGIFYNSIIVKDGIPYGYSGYDAKLFRDEYVLYVEDNILYIDTIKTNKVTRSVFLQSGSEIRDFIIDDHDNVYVLHAENKISKFNKYREYIFTLEGLSGQNAFSLTSIDQINFLKMDIVSEYVENKNIKYPIILGHDSTYRHFLVKVDEDNLVFHNAKKLNSYEDYAGHKGYKSRNDSFKINYNLTNYDYLRRTYNSDIPQLFFTVRLKNIYNNLDVTNIKIPVDIGMFKNGEYHFAFRLDSKKGMVDLFIDGKLYHSVVIPKIDYTFQDITQDSFAVGATYFYNNIMLFQHLKQKNNYISNNFTLKQFKMYNKSISDDEIKFLAIKSTGVSDMVASMPMGHRNAIEQIERIFNVNTPGNKSNTVNIIIKNNKLTNPALQENIKNIIVSKMNNILPAGVKINDIIFKNVS
jgi:hypothetical protein